MANWQRIKIEIPKQIKPADREEVALEIIDFIANRTKRNKDKDGRKFPNYTKDYAKIKGTSRSNVDLTLTGEMLDELKLISHRSGSLLIGYDRGSDINGKVEGNRLGSYGGSPNPSKARDFLGIREKELQDILMDYVNDR
jgi:hypothetical protein